MSTEILNQLNESIEDTLLALKNDLSKINLGRAQSDVFDLIKANYYGSMTSLVHMSIITVIDHNRVSIQPYDKQSIKEIEKAIRNSNLNLNPQISNGIINVCFPALTLARRDEMIKLVKAYAEKSKISIRDHRRIAIKTEESLEISKDEINAVIKKIETIVINSIKKIDEYVDSKTKILNNLQ